MDRHSGRRRGAVRRPHADLAESAVATPGWSGVDEEDVSVVVGRIDAITSTTVGLVDVGDGEAFRETATDR